MVAYKSIAERLVKIEEQLDNGETLDARNAIDTLIKELLERRRSTTDKVLEQRRKSVRAQRLHNVNNKLAYAKKINNVELIKKLEEEREYIKNNIEN